MLLHHFGTGWSGAIAPPTSPRFQQRLRKRPHTAARHRWSSTDGAVLPLHALVDCFSAGFSLGELPQERLRLRGQLPHPLRMRGPRASHGQITPVSSGHGLSFLEGCSILPDAAWTWQTVASHWRHQCGVNSQLQKSVSNHLEPATVLPAFRHQIQLTDQDTIAHPGSCLAAHSGSG